MRLDWRQPGPDDREHPCAGGCGAGVEGDDLCDSCRERFGRLGARLIRDLTEGERAWLDAVAKTLREHHMAHAEGRHPALMLADILAPRFDDPALTTGG